MAEGWDHWVGHRCSAHPCPLTDKKAAKKGTLEEDFVKLANFGGGDRESKSVKDIHEEIMAKSKAYKMIR